MRDAEIRDVLRARLAVGADSDRDAVVLEELGLCGGSVRADLVLVNGVLKGYEIKSEQDRLVRLPVQASIYSQVFDTVTLAVAERHISTAEGLVPDWWGIELAIDDGNGAGVQLKPVREELPNPSVDAYSLAQLLWRNEALQVLQKALPSRKLGHKSRSFLWTRLVESLTLAELKDAVRHALKSRIGWRVDELRRRGGEMCRPFATSSDCQVQYFGSRSRRYIYRPN